MATRIISFREGWTYSKYTHHFCFKTTLNHEWDIQGNGPYSCRPVPPTLLRRVQHTLLHTCRQFLSSWISLMQYDGSCLLQIWAVSRFAQAIFSTSKADRRWEIESPQCVPKVFKDSSRVAKATCMIICLKTQRPQLPRSVCQSRSRLKLAKVWHARIFCQKKANFQSESQNKITFCSLIETGWAEGVMHDC